MKIQEKELKEIQDYYKKKIKIMGLFLFFFIFIVFGSKSPLEEIDEIGMEMVRNLARLAIKYNKLSFVEAKEYLLSINPRLKPTLDNDIFETVYMVEMLNHMKNKKKEL